MKVSQFCQHPTTKVLLWLCVFKFVYWAGLFLALYFGGNFKYCDSLYWPSLHVPTFAKHFLPYDGCCYLSLSENGYHAGDRECAFYPLWPLVVKGISAPISASNLVVGLVLSNALSLAAWLLFYINVLERWGAEVAKWALVCLILFPGSLFFQFFYSESLFFFLLMGLWSAMERRWYWLAFAPAFLLPLTRPVGVFCLLPLLWHILIISPPKPSKLWPRWLGQLSRPNPIPKSKGSSEQDPGAQTPGSGAKLKAIQAYGLIMAPFSGWLCYLLLMSKWAGNAFEGFNAQRFWGVHSVSNLWNVHKFAFGMFNVEEWHEFSGSILDRCVFAMLLYSLIQLWKRDKGLIVWAYVLGIIPAMSGTFTSLTRFISVTFPMFIGLAFWISPAAHRSLRYVVLGSFVILHAILLWRYVNFQWAG